MFAFNEDGQFEAKLNGITFVCENVEESYEDTAEEIADAYSQRLDDIIAFMLDEGFEDCFGELSPEEIREGLGAPIVDLDNSTVTYPDHTFDDEHIISFEFDGILEEFYYFEVDG